MEQPCVLIAEDYKDQRKMMSLFFKERGYAVLVARDGFEAVEKAVEYHPDLILMDIAMPVMDGIQATQAIRRHEDLANTPILALTAYADFYDERAKDVGCNDVIQKPLDLERLEPLVRQYLD
jgi:CheY-like chemotaxis protein